MAIMERTDGGIDQITKSLGKDADDLLSFTCKGIPREQITVPGPDHVERVWSLSDRKPPVLVNLQRLYGTGRLANTGYLGLPLVVAVLGADHLSQAVAYDSLVQAPVFLIGAFAVAEEDRHRLLSYGIVLALVLRGFLA